MTIKEADWKVFRELRKIALERFCKRILLEVQDVAERDTSYHDRYLQVFRLIHERDDDIAAAFNVTTQY